MSSPTVTAAHACRAALTRDQKEAELLQLATGLEHHGYRCVIRSDHGVSLQVTAGHGGRAVVVVAPGPVATPWYRQASGRSSGREWESAAGRLIAPCGDIEGAAEELTALMDPSARPQWLASALWCPARRGKIASGLRPHLIAALIVALQRVGQRLLGDASSPRSSAVRAGRR